MIIYYSYIVSIIVDPFKDDAPLVVNANAHLPFGVVLQGFQMVAVRDTQVLHIARLVQ